MNPIDYENHPGHAEHDPSKDRLWQPSETPSETKPNRVPLLSGGEIPRESAEMRMEMIRLISAQPDVRDVHELAHRCDGTFLYLIETTFLNSWPRFVIGTCDRKLERVDPVFRCGAKWSADAEWHRIRHGENHHLHV